MTTVRPSVTARPRHGSRDEVPPGRTVRLLRALSGSLTAGLVLLAVLLGVAQWFSGPDTVPGPAIGMLVGHWVGALVAVLLQWVADRSRGRRAVIASLAAVAVVVGVLWFWWWL